MDQGFGGGPGVGDIFLLEATAGRGSGATHALNRNHPPDIRACVLKVQRELLVRNLRNASTRSLTTLVGEMGSSNAVLPHRRCPYEVLSVKRGFSDAELKSAYRKAALRWHPDKNVDNPEEAKKRFQEVSGAYAVLSDAEKRSRYDRFGFEDEGADDVFDEEDLEEMMAMFNIFMADFMGPLMADSERRNPPQGSTRRRGGRPSSHNKRFSSRNSNEEDFIELLAMMEVLGAMGDSDSNSDTSDCGNVDNEDMDLDTIAALLSGHQLPPRRTVPGSNSRSASGTKRAARQTGLETPSRESLRCNSLGRETTNAPQRMPGTRVAGRENAATRKQMGVLDGMHSGANMEHLPRPIQDSFLEELLRSGQSVEQGGTHSFDTSSEGELEGWETDSSFSSTGSSSDGTDNREEAAAVNRIFSQFVKPAPGRGGRLECGLCGKTFSTAKIIGIHIEREHLGEVAG